MKKVFILLFIFSICYTALVNAQGVGINSSGNPPDSSAILDASSNTKGVLISRMTTTERNAIFSPANGLMIWNTSTNCLDVFIVNSWQSISCGCSGPPATPGSISGTSNMCANSAGNVYSISSVFSATSYTWTVPPGATIVSGQGTTSITVTFGTSSGNISVMANNSCGSSSPSTLAITNSSTPSAPVADAANNASTVTFTANWFSSIGATTYYLDVATDNLFLNLVLGYINLNVGNVLTINVTGLNCNTTYYYRLRAENTCGTSGNSNVITYSTSSCPFICGNSITVTHTAGTIAPVTKTVTYGTVSSSLSGSNKCWITRNLGADTQASSETDATEQSAGWYWTFNKTQGYKHDGTTLTPSTWISGCNYTENSDWTTANDPCELLLGTGWRLPTLTEWANVHAAVPTISNAYASALKLHFGGELNRTGGTLQNRGTAGLFWSNTQDVANVGTHACYYSTGLITGCGTCKTRGYAVRCIKD